MGSRPRAVRALCTSPLPPLSEQRAIAAFLDRETADIDDMVTTQTALIATLRERRAAVVDSAISPAVGTGAKVGHPQHRRHRERALTSRRAKASPRGLRYVRTTDVRSMDSLNPHTVRRITAEQAGECDHPARGHPLHALWIARCELRSMAPMRQWPSRATWSASDRTRRCAHLDMSVVVAITFAPRPDRARVNRFHNRKLQRR